MMRSTTTQVRWAQEICSGLMAPMMSVLLVFISITLFAVRLPGQADYERVARFATQVVPWAIPALVVACTEVMALRLARKGSGQAAAQGALLGAIAGVTTTLLLLASGGRLDVAAGVLCLLAVAAGWAGGVLGSYMRLRPA